MIRELGKEIVVQALKDGKGIKVNDMNHNITSSYDMAFSNQSTQDELYNFTSDCAGKVLNGFNCTIIAYGQTGSGKTYTMFGEGFDDPMQSGGAGKIF